jgi:transcriptional regulator with XRE-family HTH domain
VNLLRLFRWHGLGNNDVADLLDCQAHTVGSWLAGKREPGADYLLLIAGLFNVDPRDLHTDPREFGARVSDPSRLEGMDWSGRGYVLDENGIAWRRKLAAV